MRRAFNCVVLIVLFPFLAVGAFALLVADPFQFTRMLSDAGRSLRLLFEPVYCRKCQALLSASANDEHAGICCDCVEIYLAIGKRRGRHSEFCKGRTAE